MKGDGKKWKGRLLEVGSFAFQYVLPHLGRCHTSGRQERACGYP